MYPSVLRTSRTRARSVEPGGDSTATPHLRVADTGEHIAQWIIDHGCSPLPARLHETWDQALRTQFAQSDAGHAELAVISPRTAGHFAAIADARRAGIARQLSQLEARVETLLHGLRLIVGDRQEALAAAGEF